MVVLELGLEDEAEPSLTVGICGGCDARNEQALELIVQLPQAGRPSSHYFHTVLDRKELLGEHIDDWLAKVP